MEINKASNVSLKPQRKMAILSNPSKNIEDNSSLVGLEKKISKFVHNPDRFFSDSQYKILRKIGHVYKAAKQK